MKWPWQKGFKEEREAALANLEKAKQELEGMSKSKEGEGAAPNAIDELEKALKEFSDLENLEKSKSDEEKEKEEKEKEEQLEKARKEEADRLESERLALEKSGTDDLEQELVKASEAFEGLTKSIEDSRQDTQEGMELLAKGLGSLTELVLSIGNGIVGMKKSLDERLEVLGKLPVSASGAYLGFQKSKEEEGDKTSVDEARTILIKAMEDGGEILPPGLLSRLDTKKDVSVIPADLAAKYNIKL